MELQYALKPQPCACESFSHLFFSGVSSYHCAPAMSSCKTFYRQPAWIVDAWNRIRDDLPIPRIAPSRVFVRQTNPFEEEEELFPDNAQCVASNVTLSEEEKQSLTEALKEAKVSVEPQEVCEYIEMLPFKETIIAVKWSENDEEDAAIKLICKKHVYNFCYKDKIATPFKDYLSEMHVKMENIKHTLIYKAIETKEKLEKFTVDTQLFLNEIKRKSKSTFDKIMTEAEPVRNYIETKFAKVADAAFEGVGLTSTFVKNMTVPTIDEIYEILDKLKPMNLANLIGMLAAAKSQTESSAIVSCICELYGLFWTDELFSMRQLLLSLLSWLLSYFVTKCWGPVRSAKGAFQQQAAFKTEDCKVLDEVCTFFKIEKPAELDDFGLKVFGAVIAVFIFLTGGSLSKITSFTTKKFFKNVKEFSSNVKSMSTMIDCLPKVWTFVMTEVSSWFGMTYETEASKAVENFKKELLDFKKEIHELAEMMRTKPFELLMDRARMNSAKTAMDRLDNLYDKLIHQKENMASAKGIFDSIKESMKIVDDFVVSLDASTLQKVEPFILVLSGEPGIGKSKFIAWFIKRFTERLHELYPDMQHVDGTTYVRTSTEKYWSGYKGQTFVIYDDFGQIKLDLDHMDVLSFKNPNKTILPMADIPSKGTLFSSLGVICATNQVKTTSSNVVKCSDALERRLEINMFCCDPNFEEFKIEHGCTPGDYQKTHNKIPTIKQGDEEIPYFDPNFHHLNFFRQQLHSKETPRLDAFEIVELALNYYAVYRAAYYEVLSPKLSIDINDGASTSTAASERKIISFEEAFMAYEGTSAEKEAEALVAQKIYKKKVRKYAEGVEVKQQDALLESTEENTLEFADNYIGNLEFVSSKRVYKKQAIEVDSTAKAFESFSRMKGKVYLLFGEPGTGKSCLMDYVCQSTGLLHVHGSQLATVGLTKPAMYIEEASLNQSVFEKVRELVMAVHDGKSPIQKLFLTLNPEVCNPWFNSDEQAAAFWRRCTMYSFTWNTKPTTGFMKVFNKPMFYTPDDLESARVPHSQAVKILDLKKSTKTTPVYTTFDILRMELINAANTIDLEAFNNIVTNSVPYMGRNQYTPAFIIETTEEIYPFFKALFEDPSSILAKLAGNKVRVAKGSMLEGISIAKQFTGMSSKDSVAFPDTIEEFIILINNAKFGSQKKFVTEIMCKDMSVVIMPKPCDPQNIMCFKVCPYLEVSDCRVNNGVESKPTSPAVQRIYDDFSATARAVADELETKLESAERDSNTTIGLISVKDKYPIFYSTLKIAIFAMKLVIAGTSINTLLNISKDRYHCTPVTLFREAKGKNKKKRNLRKLIVNNIKKHMKGSLKVEQYDLIKAHVEKFGTTAAKQRKATTLLSQFFDMGFTADDLHNERFNDFIMHYDPDDHMYSDDENYDDDYDAYESESKPDVVPNLPTLQPIPGLSLESRPDTVPNAPLVNPIATLILESEKKPVKPKNSKKDPFKRQMTTVTEQALADKDCVNIAKLCSRNSVELGIVRDGEFKRLVYGLMIGSNIGASVSHFLLPNETTYLHAPTLRFGEYFPIKVLTKSDKLDLCVFEISKTVLPAFKNIKKHLMPDLNSLKTDIQGRDGLIVTTEVENQYPAVYYRNIKLRENTVVKTVDSQGRHAGEVSGITYAGVYAESFIAGIEYTDAPVLTESGDCGSVVLANDSSIKHKIIGVHNSANRTEGCCSILFQSYFNSYLTQQSVPVIRSVPPRIHNIPYRKETSESLLGMPVVAEIFEKPEIPNKSKFWNSPLALPGLNPFQPAILSERDPRNVHGKHPLYSSIEKWHNKQPDMNVEHLRAVGEDIGRWYGDIILSQKKRTKVLTKTEALNNNSLFEIKGLNRDSSPGYPWRKYAKKVGDFLKVKDTDQGAYYAICEEMTEGRKLSMSVDNLLDISKVPNQYPLVTFCASCKDEPIKLAKVYDLNTRTFSGAPLDYTISSRMYFGTIQGAMNAVRHRMPIQIGIDPTSLDWDCMVKHMLSVSDIGTDLDFKGWDGKFPGILKAAGLPEVYNTIARMTDPDWKLEDDTIRTNLLYAEKTPRLHVPLVDKTYIVLADGGEPSGSPRTANDNSIGHLIMLRMSWDDICIANGLNYLACHSNFVKFVCPKIYGDDGNYAIHPSVIHFFNFETIAAWFKSKGMDCTPASKEGQVLKFMPILDFEFLKRNSEQIGNHYYGCLQEKVFYKMLGYCLGPAHHYATENRPTPIRPTDLVQTAQAAMKEALFHGPDFHEKIRSHVKKKLEHEGIIENFPRYNDAVVANGLLLPKF